MCGSNVDCCVVELVVVVVVVDVVGEDFGRGRDNGGLDTSAGSVCSCAVPSSICVISSSHQINKIK